MKEILITTQKQLDKISSIKKDEFVTIHAKKELILKIILFVYGILRVETKVNCSRHENRYFMACLNSDVVACLNSDVVARENSNVVARGNSNVVARGNSNVEAWENSHVEAWENSHVEAWENSHVEAWENSHVIARGNSNVVARGNSNVEAWENSNVVACGNSNVVAWENTCIKIKTAITLSLMGYSVLFKPADLKFKFKKSKTALVQNISDQDWFELNAIKKNKNIILYKRVSKDFKTQEGTDKETLWKVGSTVMHPNWNPTGGECGGGKFHACSKPYFCDEFRNESGDKYIAIRIALEDTYVWDNNPSYPHKIAFRKGKVLYEVNKFGKKLGV